MQIGESVSVMASFAPPYKIKPVSFEWSGRTIEVKEITYTWKSREGQKDIYHFSISDGGTLFELAFDTSSLLWRLESLET